MRFAAAFEEIARHAPLRLLPGERLAGAATLRGADPATAADYACAFGAQNVQAVDAVSGIKSWDATTAELGNPRVAVPEELRM